MTNDLSLCHVPAVGGTMQYSLDGENFSEELPAGTGIGQYTVWYKVAGDANHNDTEKASVASAIANPFPDVGAGAWYEGVVSRAIELGLFGGYADGRFGPNDNITRGQVAVVLWNMAKQPAAEAGAKNFTDVTDSSQYYYNAVRWASSVGVINGYNNGRFGPNDNVNREQLAAMIANYANKVDGREVTGSIDDLGSMADKDAVSDWAVSSVAWCCKTGILGAGGIINPQGNATRAQAAKMVVFLHDMP